MKVKILEGKTCVNNKQKKAGGSSVDIRQTDSCERGYVPATRRHTRPGVAVHVCDFTSSEPS